MGKSFVPDRVKPVGWDYPKNNLCAQYLAACEKQGVTANSSAARQLLGRVRRSQPLPYHRLIDLDREAKIDLCFDHIDVDGSGQVTLDELVNMAKAVDPRAPVEEAQKDLEFMDQDGDASISREEFHVAMGQLTGELDEEEVDQAVLEVISAQYDVDSQESMEAKYRLCFRYLDADESGSLDMQELMECGSVLDPRADLEKARKQFKAMDANKDQKITIDEFVTGMMEMGAALSDAEKVTGIKEIMDKKEGHYYDFSHAYLGPRGVAVLLPVLMADEDFVALSLRGCNIHNEGAALIAKLMAAHPKVQSLDLADNPIGDPGAEALLEMLKKNPNIKKLNVENTHIDRKWSNTAPVTGPRKFEDAAPLKEQLEVNAKHVKEEVQLVDISSILREHRQDVKVLFYSLAGVDGRVSYLELIDGLRERAEDWGILPEQLVNHLSADRIFAGAEIADVDADYEGAGTDPQATAEGGDATGDQTLSYAEFLAAVRRENVREHVREAIKKYKDEVKKLFFKFIKTSASMTFKECVDEFLPLLEPKVSQPVADLQSALTLQAFFGLGAFVDEEDGLVYKRLAGDGLDGWMDELGEPNITWSTFYTAVLNL